MNFELSHEQQLLIDTARAFVERELYPHEELVERADRVPPELIREIQRKAIELGLFAANLPEDSGGGGLSAFDMTLLDRELGRASFALHYLVARPSNILLACTAEQREQYLLPCIRGEKIDCLAMTEPDAGSDLRGMKCKADRQGDNYIINGSKHFISHADLADFVILFAATGVEETACGSAERGPTARGPRKKITAFLVDKGTPGFSVGRDQPMMGIRGTSHLELHFDEVELDDANLLGAEGEGLGLTLAVLGRVRLAQVAARAIGKATKILGLTLDYARERKQFGQRLGDFQMVQQMLADSEIEINAARAALWQCAWEIDQGLDPRAKISALKVQASETLGRVADRAMQIFGGMGYSRDLPIERYYRDARIYRIFDGASEIHRGVIAKSMLKGGVSVFDPFAAE